MAYNFNVSIHEGRYTIKVDTDAQYGYFEHDDGGEGGLWFERNVLVDQDGTMMTPRDVIVGLRKLGFTVPRSFEA